MDADPRRSGFAPDSASRGRRPPAVESWSAQQLAEFATLISTFEDEREAMVRGVERIAELLDAGAAALTGRGAVVEVSVGFPEGEIPAAALAAVAEGKASRVPVPGMGECAAACVTVHGDRELRVIVTRAGEPFGAEQLSLLRGTASVLSLGLSHLALLRTERALREDSQRQADESARLLAELRQRQVVLERLAQLQRSIVEREAIHEVLDAVVDTAAELLADDVAGLRLLDPDDPTKATPVAVTGADDKVLSVLRRPQAEGGLGGRAIREQRLVVADAASGVASAAVAEEFAAMGVLAAMAAPVHERDDVVGSLLVGSRREGRVYGSREQQALLSLAEHASLALNHARAVDDAVHEALHDSLTGLPNRSLFLDRLDHALARAERSGSPVGVLFCDLDGFKTVNDSLGHGAGDRLLSNVAERLAHAVRPADTIGRLGGDEFAVLLEEVDDPGEAARVARRVLEALEVPFEVRGREVFLSASIGIAAGRADAETLLRNADLAMSRAKGRGRGHYAAFEPEMHRAVVERLDFELDLKRAIERQELMLVYQPVCNLRSGAVVGLEALVRWRHPTRGLVAPERFVPLAEESGEIKALGRWVLRSACHQVALWRARYPAHAGLRVGVNISSVQLLEPGLVAEVADALAAAQVDGGALTLEITETVLMKDFEAAIRQLEAAKELGVDVAIDDFGIGYSSLRYLRRLPLDNLKVDRSFVAGIGRPGEEPALLRAIIDLAEIFGLAVVAEGIENPAQRQRLLELGCEMGQGHLFARALPADEADAFLLSAGLLGTTKPAVEEPAGPGAPAGRRSAEED